MMARATDDFGGRTAADDNEAVMARISARLKAQLGPEIFASWFQRMHLDHVGKGVCQVSVPTAFLRSWIRGHYDEMLTEAFKAEVPGTLRVDVVVRSAIRGGGVRMVQKESAAEGKSIGARASGMAANGTDGAAASPAVSSERAKAPSPARPSGVANGCELGSPLDPRYVFDTLVEGAANRVAMAAGRAIAENGPQSFRFNPLFVHAGVGLGKTHLLQAIANAAAEREDAPRVVYLTAEYFMWRFASAIRDNKALDLKDALRGTDVLIIDDVQFLQGKSIQHEFCHLLNALIDSAKHVICAADRPAKDLESLDPRVRSRLSNGITLEIAAPDYAMRRAIVEMRIQAMAADDLTFSLPEETIDAIARRVDGTGRDLEGAFNQIAFRHSLGQPLTPDAIGDLLSQFSRSTAERRVRIEDILKFVSRHYNISRTDILSARRTRTIVRPRQIAMYLAKTMTPRSLPEIGRRFGGRDHTTVLHAVRKIEAERGKDEAFSEELDVIRRMIEE
ncbi:chromosomal replication initiator protein DnaA [Fulvimarina endophytica]|uniref:Chromosomal replication initiator protein DnaA n=1 Tax=Fulvimarina endophytica TaxID=2293836 RepID=A0A371WZT5_9HYPH|nr:chromosomal replication initiator protein DnaA [Fulvimarina endophytica]RFC62482.1 chromosomal replication initiator protein DnaA [Fulvimarina endophytica]